MQGEIRQRVSLFASPTVFTLEEEVTYLAWQALLGLGESRTGWLSILFPSLCLKDRGGWGVGQPAALGTHAAGKGLGLNIKV